MTKVKTTMTSQPTLIEKTKRGLSILLPFFVIVFGLSTGIFIITSRFPQIIEFLSASPRTPWGIVTSLFTHLNMTHLSTNMYSLFLFSLSILVSNVFLPQEELEKRLLFVIPLVLTVPVVLNIVWIILNPRIASLGSSGIVYTLIGAFVGYSILNSLELFRIDKYSQIDRNLIKVFSVLNLLFSFMYLLIVIYNPQNFLGSARGTNIFIHVWAFYSGTVAVLLRATYIWLTTRKFKEKNDVTLLT